uniref:BHLH domain-containing protein n=1 Tax=Globodera pallida TaxID=36090 RepID=A0A183BW19_GLOPA
MDLTRISNEFGFFKVKWYACKLDMGFGPGISWIGDDCFQRSSAASETSTCNTSQFKRESDNYWNRLKQLRKHRKNKKALPGISNELVKFFTDKYQDFSSARKERGKKLPGALASVEQIQNIVKYIATMRSTLGALAINIKSTLNIEQDAKKVIGIHERPITDVSLHPTGDFALCCSEDSHW